MSTLLMEIPIIDIAALFTTGSEEFAKLRSALCSWGCFQAINHGIPDEPLDKVRELGREFFKLPLEEKHKCKETNCLEGYGTDLELGRPQECNNRGDRSYLYLKSIPEEHQKLNIWPNNPQDFRKTFQEHSRKMHTLSEILLKAAARSLKLEENSFLKQLGKGRVTGARFNFYPPVPAADQPIIGFKPHSDVTTIILMLQDKTVGGLEFLKDDGRWVTSPIIPNAFLVLAGDQLEIMSNGIFKSPIHRVVTIPNTEKISVVGFVLPESEMEIKPVDELIDETRPRLYKKVTNYFAAYLENYGKTERFIDEMKITI
ncbi:hypothetical protein ACFE04_009559 [Oxalis oulophora]